MAQEQDVVLITLEDEPMAFARIEAIEPDAKPEWFQVRLLLLQIPLQMVTWILRAAYIDGTEFTMDGKRVRIEVVPPVPDTPPDTETAPTTEAPVTPPRGNVISLSDLKKK